MHRLVAQSPFTLQTPRPVARLFPTTHTRARGRVQPPSQIFQSCFGPWILTDGRLSVFSCPRSLNTHTHTHTHTHCLLLDAVP